MHSYTRHNQDIAWTAIQAIETGNIEQLAKAKTAAQDNFDTHLYDLSGSFCFG